jgi:hypothetical protein
MNHHCIDFIAMDFEITEIGYCKICAVGVFEVKLHGRIALLIRTAPMAGTGSKQREQQ